MHPPATVQHPAGSWSTQRNPYKTHSQPGMKSTIELSKTSTPPEPLINPPKDPTTIQLHQPVLLSDPTNEPWGDTITKDLLAHIFWVISCNVNTINPAKNFIKWQAVVHALHDFSVGVACLQETNTQWTPPLLNRVWQIFHQLPTQQAALATSSSKDVTLGNYQPGGTCTVVLGKWTSCIRFTNQDSRGLGRWSYIEFEGRNAHQIIIMTAYQSCSQPTQLGLITFHNQQYRLLLEAGQSWPDPRLQFLDDLIDQVHTWHHQQKAVLICMDANDDVTWLNPKKGIGWILAKMDLLDLHHYLHPSSTCPPTYNWGQLTLDFCLGSPNLFLLLQRPLSFPLGFRFTYQVTTKLLSSILIAGFSSAMLFQHWEPPTNGGYTAMPYPP